MTLLVHRAAVRACVLVAALVRAAWLALGSPCARAARGVDAGRQARRTRAYTGGARPAVLRPRRRHRRPLRRPGESQDDPGLADAIHVIGVNPALRCGHDPRHPARHRGAGRPEAELVHRELRHENLRAEADAVSSVIGVPIPYVVRVNFPHFSQLVDEIGGIDINIPPP